MIMRGIIAFLILTFVSVVAFVACDVISEKGLRESLDTVPNVSIIKGAENANIRVNGANNSIFNVDIQNVEWNTLISNGAREGWCIAWKDPISSNNALYEGLGIYSTAGDKNFDDVNRLFTIKNSLMKADPGITWREIQVAIWSLIPFQSFDMNMSVSDLPGSFVKDGQANFDKEKVQFVIDAVRERSTAKTARFDGLLNNSGSSKTKTMCVIGTNPDTQTLIVPCDETAFAYGGNFPASYTGVAGIPGEDGFANCFPEDDELSIQRWGWSNGKLGAGQYSFPLYAGAGQCILSKGQYSGDVEINYSGGTVTVTFKAAAGTSFAVTHLHVGSEKLPKKNGVYTAAPGQYPNNNDIVSSSDTEVVYQVSGLSGEIYVVAHAVMNGYEDEAD
jgi:hypothetical protein